MNSFSERIIEKTAAYYVINYVGKLHASACILPWRDYDFYNYNLVSQDPSGGKNSAKRIHRFLHSYSYEEAALLHGG